MKKIKKILLNLFILLFFFNNNSFAKPLPPGSGAGDVPANILLLLDTSASMDRIPKGGDSLFKVLDILLLNDGNLLLATVAGVYKMIYETKKLDTDFGNNGAIRVGEQAKGMTTCSLEDDDELQNNGNFGQLSSIDKSSNMKNHSGEAIFFTSPTHEKVGVYDTDGLCLEMIWGSDLGKDKKGTKNDEKFMPKALSIRTIDSNDHLLVTSTELYCKTSKKKKKNKCGKNNLRTELDLYSRNLTTGVSRLCTNISKYDNALKDSTSITMDLDGDDKYLYSASGGLIYRMNLSLESGTYCPTGNLYTVPESQYKAAYQIELDPQNMNVMYITSKDESAVQKLSISGNTFSESILIGGSDSSAKTPASAANIDESPEINIFKPLGLDVSNDRVWTSGEKISIQEYNISSERIRWVLETGTSRVSRLEGAKNALSAVVNDSSLLQGAKFGYGYWNAGRIIVKKTGKGKAKDLWKVNGDYACNVDCPYNPPPKYSYRKCNNNCIYYDSWQGAHPSGKSKWCNGNSCLAVGIDKGTSEKIVQELDSTITRFGTDANAFAQLAYKYYNDPNVKDKEGNRLATKDKNERLDCQLNYVIVIGDGQWRHHDQAKKLITKLRTDYGVKTLVVAYGDEISSGAKNKFNEMALAGTCDDETGEAEECRGRIDAETPSDLLTKLKSEIERIIASRLSFTAPSITANVQEGGSLYQAQFNYVKHGEWHGSLIRKKISADGSIVHDLDAQGNYDAAVNVRNQAESDTRKIWTTLPGADYRNENWNNFTEDNASKINKLFTLTGDKVPDFHNSNSNCKGKPGVEDGNADDIKGLINFVRGKDYFAYEGCDNLNNTRTSVLGDIYHSQIVEVGKPKASTSFSNTNQESYWRKINGYRSWSNSVKREKVMYVGANDGALHAFYTSGPLAGQEVWAFVPPFIAGQLPSLVNEALDGINSDKGGTNSIFAVDGSPVIHDVYIRGLDSKGNYIPADGPKSWHTILFIPYGRGGAGFSVLDITNPLTPYHMFSVYNDRVNSVVMVANNVGDITPHAYSDGTFNLRDSLEANKARGNQRIALDADLVLDELGSDFTNRDAKSTCQSNEMVEALSGNSVGDKYYNKGTMACYKGSTFTFISDDFPKSVIDNPALATVVERGAEGEIIETPVKSVVVNGSEITFTIDTGTDGLNLKVYNASDSEESDLEQTDFTVQLSEFGVEDTAFNYSTLGETWGTPRIIRMPTGNTTSDTLYTDRYVAVLPGGYGVARNVGSSLFLVDLEDTITSGGSIYDAAINNGPIKIIDLENEIPNSIPTDPIVITPDTFRGIKWRGAMVYLNDFEGKITKINLTSQNNIIEEADSDSDDARNDPVNLYDQTTIFNLNVNKFNQRYSYFGMDAAYGNSTRNLWLFGGTGDFANIGSKELGMDNLLYGVRDRHFPNFRHSINGVIPSQTTEQTTESGEEEDIINPEFEIIATKVALLAANADDPAVCADSRNDRGSCPGAVKEAWIFKLEKSAQNFFRKASASPTIFGGIVYYPVYEPPLGQAKCSVGNAFICAADDECGINQSQTIANQQKKLREGSKFDSNSGCYYLQAGILSKLVVGGNKLFGNVTTESDKQEDTLVQLLGGDTDLQIYRGSWRENY